MRKIILALMAASLPLSVTAAPSSVRPGDWPEYGYDSGGGRYSPLTQITPQNVNRLQLAWSYHMNPVPSQKQARVPFATTSPLVVDGRMFLGTPYGRVVALDATTGKQLWAYELPTGDQPPFRGLGYWPGDARHAPRLIFGTLRGRMVALDAATGAPSKGFGENGMVDTKTPEIMNGLPDAFYGYSAPPVIYKNIAITGSRVQESPSKGAAGDARAWNVITGKLEWTFHSIPRPGEKFHETWEDDGWKQRSGVNIWNMLSVDQARGIAYLPFGAPTFDRYGGDHKGANLFANSLVAVEAATGKYLWHFQTVHHDIWDLDLHTTPVLLTVKKEGKEIPAVAVMNKTAFLFLLNRVTGEPIYGVTEKPVPPSSVASEKAWPTQPFPNKPEPMTRMAFDLSEVADNTPEHRAICQGIIDKGQLVGSKMFEPIRDDRTMIRFPGAAGGVTFIGGTDDARFRAFDSRTGKELWTVKLDYSAHATPITYQGKDGRQYVAIVATGGSYLNSPTGGDSLLVYALPK